MKEPTPMSLRFSAEVRQRLKECSDRTGIPERTLAQMAIEAAVDAIVQNDYRLVVPIEFEVARVPVDAKMAKELESPKPASPGKVQRYPGHKTGTKVMQGDPSMNEKPGPQKPDRTIKLSETERS